MMNLIRMGIEGCDSYDCYGDANPMREVHGMRWDEDPGIHLERRESGVGRVLRWGRGSMMMTMMMTVMMTRRGRRWGERERLRKVEHRCTGSIKQSDFYNCSFSVYKWKVGVLKKRKIVAKRTHLENENRITNNNNRKKQWKKNL